MGGSYVAIFLLPTPVTKRLESSGWEFESPARLPEELVKILTHVYSLHFIKRYLGMDIFDGDSIQMAVIRDARGNIENISIQWRAQKADNVRAVLNSARFQDVEVFVPCGSTDAGEFG